jgi:hypothetical protein
MTAPANLRRIVPALLLGLISLWSSPPGLAAQAEGAHPAAPAHLPFFITRPGETDVLMVAMAIVLGGTVLLAGILFFRLHTLPERIAHKSQKLQFEIVAVLGLLALFTHIHLFWVAGLLLALIEFPDFSTPLSRMAGSLETLAARRRRAAGLSAQDDVAASPPSPDGVASADLPKPDEHEVPVVLPGPRPRRAEGA